MVEDVEVVVDGVIDNHTIQELSCNNLSALKRGKLNRDAYFTLFVDIHPGKVCAFYSVYLTNREELPFFGHFYPGRVYNFLENIHPCLNPNPLCL